MNEDKLNNDLKNRIREVFDDYNDTGADEGWLQLRQKFPLKEKDRGLGWLWYAAAAVVLLFLTIWLMPRADKTKPVIAQHIQNRGSDKQENNILPSIDTLQQSTDHIAETPHTNFSGGSKSATYIRQLPVANPAGLTAYKATPNIKSSAAAPAGKQDHIIPSSADSSTHIAVNSNDDKLMTDTGEHIANTTIHPRPALPVTGHKKDIYDLLTQQPNNGDEQKKKTGNKPIISVYAATYFNYARGSDNHINIGGGFTSDFHLTNKLKLSTGLAIAQNTLSYSNSTEPNSQQHEAAYATLAKEVAKASGSPITGDGTTKSLAVFATNFGGTKSYNASLIGLDIPVNLKYEFNPQKSDVYVSAGLSSGTFISETYRAVYSYSQVTKESDTHNSFNGFDVAKTLNFSFGVGYPLGKYNRLIVEPFFKYPLDGLGQQQIRFGAGGVNLKLNFRSLKK